MTHQTTLDLTRGAAPSPRWRPRRRPDPFGALAPLGTTPRVPPPLLPPSRPPPALIPSRRRAVRHPLPSRQVRHKAIAIAIEEELSLTPWALTSNFFAYRHGRAQLAIVGIGDPSGTGEAHSFTRLRTAREEREELKERAKTAPPNLARQRSIFDTIELARRMTKAAAVTWLQEHGVAGLSKDNVKKLSRADCRSMVCEQL